MNRIFKSGIVTTVIGLTILGISIYMWVAQKASQLECFTMAGMGLMFLRSKDSLIGIPPKED